MSAEPTAEQQEAARAAVWPEANRLMWKFATDDDKATCDRVARALAAAVAAEREKVLTVLDGVEARLGWDETYTAGYQDAIRLAARRIREVSR